MIQVECACRVPAGPYGRAFFTRCAAAALRSVRRGEARLSFVLMGDREIRKINRKFLGHDYATDVITFPLEEDAIDAEICISVETARRQAAQYGVTVGEELARLAVHGVLHLVGHDDTDEAGRAAMHAREDACLHVLFPGTARREPGLPSGSAAKHGPPWSTGSRG
jgi:probable rRNA maturation factor